jgi:hypothetical protein
VAQLSQFRANATVHLRLEQAGFGIGQRAIELISCRDRRTGRETRLVNMLQVLWVAGCRPYLSCG